MDTVLSALSHRSCSRMPITCKFMKCHTLTGTWSRFSGPRKFEDSPGFAPFPLTIMPLYSPSLHNFQGRVAGFGAIKPRAALEKCALSPVTVTTMTCQCQSQVNGSWQQLVLVDNPIIKLNESCVAGKLNRHQRKHKLQCP